MDTMRREGGDREAIVRLLLDFSGLLERDWCRDRRDDPRGNGAHDNGNPIGGGVEAGGEAGVGMGTAGRRIEGMGVVLEQLAPLVDWNSEVKTREKKRCLISILHDKSYLVPRKGFARGKGVLDDWGVDGACLKKKKKKIRRVLLLICRALGHRPVVLFTVAFVGKSYPLCMHPTPLTFATWKLLETLFLSKCCTCSRNVLKVERLATFIFSPPLYVAI